MRSARTAPPAPPGNPPPRPRRAPPSPLRLVCFALLTALALGGCSSGAATDARRGEEADAAEGASLPALQATRTAGRFFPPTSTPGPTPPAAPTLESLVITLGLGAGDAPLGEYSAVPADAGTAYAGALLHNLRAGQVVTASWASADGVPIATSEVRITADAAQRWVALPLSLTGGVMPGEYAVFVAVDNRWLTSIVFRVLPMGSWPQRLPDPPTTINVDDDRPAEPEETFEEDDSDDAAYVEPSGPVDEAPVNEPEGGPDQGLGEGGPPPAGVYGTDGEVPIVPVDESR